MKCCVVICLILLCAAVAAAGQYGPAAPVSDPASFTGAPRASDLIESPSATGFSLLDPSRFKMSQSYSMSYFSGSGHSGSVGLYMNTMTYQLSEPLTVRVGLGYLHEPLGFLDNSGARSELGQGRLLPNVSLEYRPSNRFQLLVDFRTVPTYGQYGGLNRNGFGPYSGLYNPWHW